MPKPAPLAGDDSLVRDVIDNGQVSLQQLLVIGICLLLNMLDGFDITAMAVVASAVADELVLTDDRLGWVFSFALAGMMTGAMFLAPVSDLIGRRRLILLSVSLVAVSILLTAAASSLLQFVVLRFVAGVGAGAMLACQAALAAEYSPEKYRAFSVVAVVSGYPLGAMLTSVAASVIMPEFGWRGMFLFGGVVTLCMAVAALLLLPESLKYLLQRRPRGALQRINGILAKLKKPTLDELPGRGVDQPAGYAAVWRGMTSLLAPQQRNKTLTLWLAFFLGFASVYFLMSWIPRLMDNAGYESSVGRNAFFLFNLGGVIGTYVLGLLSTRLKLSNLIAVLFLAAGIAMTTFALAPREPALMMVLIFIIGALQQGGFTGLYSAAAKAYPTDVRSTGIGWAIGLGRFGAVAGPAAAGYLIVAGFGISANFLVFALPMIAGAALAWRLNIR